MAKREPRAARRRRQLVWRRRLGAIGRWLTSGLVLTVAWGTWTVLSEVPVVEPPNSDDDHPLSLPFVVENRTGFTFYGVTAVCVAYATLATGEVAGLVKHEDARLGRLGPGDRGSVTCGNVPIMSAEFVVLALKWRRFGFFPRERQYGFAIERTPRGHVSWVPTGQEGSALRLPADSQNMPAWGAWFLSRTVRSALTHGPQNGGSPTPEPSN